MSGDRPGRGLERGRRVREMRQGGLLDRRGSLRRLRFVARWRWAAAGRPRSLPARLAAVEIKQRLPHCLGDEPAHLGLGRAVRGHVTDDDQPYKIIVDNGSSDDVNYKGKFGHEFLEFEFRPDGRHRS